MNTIIIINYSTQSEPFISNRFLEDSDLPKEFNRCADIRDYLLRTAPQNIDINKVKTELDSMKEKFKSLPEVLDQEISK